MMTGSLFCVAIMCGIVGGAMLGLDLVGLVVRITYANRPPPGMGILLIAAGLMALDASQRNRREGR